MVAKTLVGTPPTNSFIELVKESGEWEVFLLPLVPCDLNWITS
jgi:hypothetical protein